MSNHRPYVEPARVGGFMGDKDIMGELDMVETSSMPIELSDGAKVAVHLDGVESAFPLTFTHSLAYSSAMWEPQRETLTRYFRLIRMDFRGHGGSSLDPAPKSFGRLAEDVVEVWDALGVERSHYCGLSLGGIVGAVLAIGHSERIDRLILADCRFDATPGYLQNWEHRTNLLDEGGMTAIADYTIPTWLTAPHRGRDPALVQQLRSAIEDTPAQAWRNIVAIFPSLDLKHRLSAITRPTLFLSGAEDAVCQEMEVCARLVPYATFLSIAEAAHLANIDQPERFTDALVDFLSSPAA